MKADIALMNSYISEHFTEAESKTLIDHKVMNSIRDAAKYAELKDAKKLTEKKLKATPKAIKPSVKKDMKPQQKKSPADDFYSKPK